ncbi:hypothetical protein PV325_012233, partial [Microctonus aethiopoides]
DRCAIDAVYEHQLPRFPASLTAGPFGGVKGRDFFCVQCLDGTLIFYEQESHTFNQSFKDRLLPERLTYVAKNDVFITINPGWIIECYRLTDFYEIFCVYSVGLRIGCKLFFIPLSDKGGPP